MDDLKIILYVVVAIIWVVYNNYRKITDAAKKRNLAQPPQEPVTGPQNYEPPHPVAPSRPKREVIEKQPRKPLREVLSRKQIPVPATFKHKLRKERPAFITSSFSTEGGPTSPSKIVKFEEPEDQHQVPNPILKAFRTTDVRMAIIMGEVLKRPNF